MKVLLFSEGKKMFAKSGVGRALKHQMEALKHAGLQYTTDEKEKFDVAHINTIGAGSERIIKRCRKNGIPVVYNTHTTFEDFKNSFMFSNIMAPFIKMRLKKLYKMADHIISPSSYTLGLIRSYGVELPAEVVSNGVDTVSFVKNRELAEKFKEEYKIEGKSVICVGLPFRRKGILDFCEIAEKMPDTKFIWFGANITSIVTPDVRKKVANPPKNVIFPGYVPAETIIGAYSGADAFFFPTYEENEGIVVLEALSMGCPVVVRDIPVYKEWLEHGKNCFKGKSNSEFEEILKGICSTSKNIEEIISAGRKTAEERDLKIIGERLKKIYGSLSRGIQSRT